MARGEAVAAARDGEERRCRVTAEVSQGPRTKPQVRTDNTNQQENRMGSRRILREPWTRLLHVSSHSGGESSEVQDMGKVSTKCQPSGDPGGSMGLLDQNCGGPQVLGLQGKAQLSSAV